MRRSFCQFLSASLCVVVLVLGVGCERQSAPEALVLKVGVIASLSGEGQRDGAITVNCATVIADYYNEQGGVEVDGEHYRVELLVRDDTSEASQAAEIAYDFVNLGDVHYVIGAEGDAVSEAVAPILDSAGILYLHYGLSYRLLARASCGVLARPRSIQMFARVVDYLKENQDDQEELSICLLVGKTRAAMYQKLKIEEMVEQAGIEVVRFARFDVTEAVFDLSETPEVVESFVARVVSSQPSLVILCGQQDGSLPLAMSYLRGGGYTGGVIARSPRVLIDRGVEGSWVDGLLLVSSSVPIEERSRYYLDLKERYLDQF
ncbi:MAG: branched-chain amino acid transport system substrate-binding protein [Lentimonas sp.]|jgi:branched-chain amino acid transport system substrate-binding protein